MIVWDLDYFNFLKTINIPSQYDFDGKEQLVYSMKFLPTKKEILFICLEEGDVHELNIYSGHFLQTYFLNFGKHANFCFDDTGFFLASLNSDLDITFYRKDIFRFQSNEDESQQKIELPSKAKERFFNFSKRIISRSNENDLFFNPQKRKHLTFFDLKQINEEIPNKPLLSLKVFADS